MLNNYRLVKNGYGKNTIFYEEAKLIDEKGFIDKKLATFLKELFNQDYEVGVFNPGIITDLKSYLEDIYLNGLKIRDNKFINSKYNMIYDAESNINFYGDFLWLVKKLKDAYKEGSNGLIIVKIPKSYIGRKKGSVKPIYTLDDSNNQRLLSEYIVGYIPLEKNICKTIYINKDYKDIHEYSDDSLIYDPDVKNR